MCRKQQAARSVEKAARAFSEIFKGFDPDDDNEHGEEKSATDDVHVSLGSAETLLEHMRFDQNQGLAAQR